MKLPKFFSRYNTTPNLVAVVVILCCAFTWWLRCYSPVHQPMQGVRMALIDTATIDVSPNLHFFGPKDTKNIKSEHDRIFTTDEVTKQLSTRRQMLHRGDSVEVLAHRKSRGMTLVQLPNGERGYISSSALTREWKVVDTDKNENLSFGDTLTFSARENDWRGRFVFTTQSGDTVKMDPCRAIPAFMFEHLDHLYSEENIGELVMSLHTFNKKIKGKTLEQVDSLFIPATYVRHAGDKTYAWYFIGLYDSRTGGTFCPLVCFEDGEAQVVNRAKGTGMQSWIVSMLPFDNEIMDCFGWLLATPGYDVFGLDRLDYMGDGVKSGPLYWLLFVLALIVVAILLVAFVLFWCATFAIPMMVLYILLHNPWPFKWLGNIAMLVVGFVVLAGGFYVWTVLVLAYDNFLWPLPFIPMCYVFVKVMDHYTELLSLRCGVCRNIDTYYVDHREYHEEFDRWEDEVKSTRVASRLTGKWKTWTDVTTTKYYSDGSKSSSTHKKDEKTHSQYEDTYQHDHYKVLYHVKPYTEFHKCRDCGNTYTEEGENKTVLKRNYVGRDMSTNTRTETN